MIQLSDPMVGQKLTFSEPTVRDIELANALGYERPTNIRSLIKRNLPMLEALGIVASRAAPIVSGKGRISEVTEYHLTKPQAAFIIAKSGTRKADSLAALFAELLGMVSDGKLAPVSADAAAEAQAAVNRQTIRLAAINAEERDARSDAFTVLGRGRSYGPGGRAKPQRHH